ncbi:TetR/AcrR family transcriptional regulator [Fulvivirga sediminis]|uniref:TetR/AcrR family transcriptional regulator n=1 Tax=Fulvivirga sediminis TaxID=2803949 RepID=A0A937F8I7_9BACT|nr:TetR/AcrR family transcriptional regulator [Fulvivirga sediminis]MBL3657121.1 TetR/AcrR family transcriptional regulator [Fulvivirga sediminis]
MNSPRERILEVTSELFHQQGYNSTGINQIIKEAKVAKASFYQHFESKENLCVEYLNNRHTYWLSEFSKFISTEKEPKSKTLRAFDFIIFMNENEHFRGCAFLNILSEISKEQHNILSIIQSHKSALRNSFMELIDNELIALNVYLLFESAIIESQLFQANEIVHKTKIIVNHII